MFALLSALLVAGAAQPVPLFEVDAAQPVVSPTEVCELLSAEEILAVQGATVRERKLSDQRQTSRRFAQCVFATADFTRSVSLTIVTGDTAGYWADTFGPRQRAASRKKDPPRPIPAVGDEAFWTGDGRAGALYVLSAPVVLRISVGGAKEEGERIDRSTALARAALRRLR
jgi:hypothetical protein